MSSSTCSILSIQIGGNASFMDFQLDWLDDEPFCECLVMCCCFVMVVVIGEYECECYVLEWKWVRCVVWAERYWFADKKKVEWKWEHKKWLVFVLRLLKLLVILWWNAHRYREWVSRNEKESRSPLRDCLTNHDDLPVGAHRCLLCRLPHRCLCSSRLNAYLPLRQCGVQSIFDSNYESPCSFIMSWVCLFVCL